ncbi:MULTISPECIES: hypothetical protein [Bradyrhizobium]|nr:MULTISPECIES: hypothetical protein [Bradyrhizobium]UFW46412.1 hypothetical protein BaraCB756_29435 [Bradyrhizobium arachidis]
MDNRVAKPEKVIRALRISMREAEAIMHEQINKLPAALQRFVSAKRNR